MHGASAVVAASSVDDRVIVFFADHRTPWATTFAEGLMNLGSVPNLAVAGLIGVVVAVILHQWRVAAAVVLAVFAASVAVSVLKRIFGWDRPPWELAIAHAQGYAMPSGEATRTSAAATAFVVAVTWSSRRLMLACIAILVVTLAVVGVCMVYLGAHWPSDVLVGWALGTSIGGAIGLLFREADPRSEARADAAEATA